MNVNKVFLAGNLTRDVELRYTPGGMAVAAFGMAINRKFKSKSGEQKEEVCFVDINAFGRTGEVISEYLSKGNPVYIEGRLQFNQWETKDGQKRNTLRVVADSFQFIPTGGKKGTQGEAAVSKDSDAIENEPGMDLNMDVDNEQIPF